MLNEENFKQTHFLTQTYNFFCIRIFSGFLQHEETCLYNPSDIVISIQQR